MKPVIRWFDDIPENYVYGFFTGLIFISVFLASQYGYNFCFLSGSGFLNVPSFAKALHWVTMITLCSMFLFYYYSLRHKPSVKRLFISFMFLVFFWQVHDFLWIIKWVITGARIYGTPLIYPTLLNLVVGFSRNFVLFTVSIVSIRNYFRVSKAFIGFAVFQLGYWIFLMLPRFSAQYHYIMFCAPFIQIVDSLPYFWIVKEGNMH